MEAAMLRQEDEMTRAYDAAWLHGRATWGKLPPLRNLLASMRGREALSVQLDQLSEHLGVGFRKASPETIAALARLRASG